MSRADDRFLSSAFMKLRQTTKNDGPPHSHRE
jgi:hypothetical protein